MIELRKYLKDAIDGQTYALHLLFTPLEFTEYYNNIWAYIWLNRNKLISRNMEPYIGYCRHQAAKYGLKGSRLGEMIRLVEFLKTRNPDDTLKMVMNDFTTSEFIKLIPHQVRYNKEWKTEDWWYILGKLFAQNSAVKYVIHSCEYFMNTYGERARLAQQNEGIDWKAISHAYRCMFQLEEIADTGTLIFPLRSAEKLKAIKLGQVSYSVCQDELPQIIDRVTQKIAISPHVADKPDIKFWDDFIVSTYLTQVHENPRNI
jgi:hypothetical protein